MSSPNPAGLDDEFANLLADLVGQIGDYAVYTIDRNGVIRTWNEGARLTLGYSADAAIGSHFSILHAKDDRLAGRPLAALRAAERDGRQQEEGVRVRADGSRLIAHAVTYPLRRDGETAGFAVVLRDIGEARRVAEALEESERRMRLLFEGIADHAVYLVDPDGIVQSWNPGGERIKGYAADEIIGQHFACFFSSEERDAGKPMRALKAAAERGRYEEEGTQYRRDGTPFAAHLVIGPIYGTDGRVAGYAAITRDVTEQQNAARALRESENRFRLMIESVTDHAICTLDPTGIVTSWTQGAQRITGYAADEVLGEHFAMFYTDRDRRDGRPYRALDIAREHGRYAEEGMRVRKDGSRFAADVALHAIRDEQGALSGFAKITRDVTERKKRELAESANAAKSYFLAQMSHEFRTPLNAIIGFSEIISAELLGKIGNERYVSYGSDIHASGLHLLSLVNDLLDLTRIEAGRLEANVGRFDIKPVAEQAIRLFESVGRARRIRIELNVAGELSDFTADERMVRQCVVNLVDNAIKHSQAGSTVRVAIGRLDDRLTIRVIDQGKGMAESDIPRALEPFGRIRDVMTTPVDGVGLGLPLVKSYCELHGGALAIRSAPSAGTEVVLSFPYPGGARKPAGSAAREMARARNDGVG
jgi:PAS domain S-box-containing protein